MTSSSSSAFSRLILPSLVWLSVSLLAIGSASAASADKIYFTASTSSSATTDSLNRIDADGTNQTVLAADTANFLSPDMCAVDSTAGFVWVADGAGSFKLIRYDLNGSSASRAVIYTANTNQSVRGVMVHTASQKLYVITNSATAADDRLIQMNYDGTGAVDLAAGATHFQQPAYGCIDPVRGYVYVADNFGNNTSAGLLRYNLDGTGRTQVKTWTELNPNPGTITTMAIQGVAVDRSTGQIYVVTSSGTATADRVQRVNADFSGLVELMAGSANFNNPVSIHVDRARNRLLVGDLGTTTAVNIFAFDLNGGNKTTFTTVTATTGTGYTAGIALHSLTAPTISDVGNQNVAMNGNTGALAVTVNDAETALSDLLVYGTSSNTTLVPDSNIVTGGSGGSRTVTVTPAAGQTGSATITLYVDDGQRQTTDTFTVNVTAPSNNADLAALTTTASGFAPTFAAGTTAYTANVPNATTSVTVTATRAEANATMQVRVNGGSFTALTSGSPSSALSLNVGANPIDVRVTAQDGTTIKTYTITVTRAAASGTIAPNDLMVIAYDSDGETFALLATADIPDGTTIHFTDRGWNQGTSALRAGSTFETNIAWVTSGVTAGKIVRISMPTAASFIGTSYGVLSGAGTFDESSGDQLLIYTTADNNSASPPTFIHAFNGDRPADLNVANDDGPFDGWTDTDVGLSAATSHLPAGLTAVLTAGDGGSGYGLATYQSATEQDNYIYNGPTSQTTRSAWIARITTPANWSGTDIPVNIQTDGSLSPANYLIGAPPSNNADLASLTLSAGAYSPGFNAATTTGYTLNVANGTSTTTVTATRAEANATLAVQVNGGGYTALTSGSASSALALNVGPNPIDVRVTAQDGTTIKTYTITVTRAPLIYNVRLSGLVEAPINNSAGTGSGTVTINNTTRSMTINLNFSGLSGNTTAAHIHAATASPFTGTAGVATTTPSFVGFPLGVTSGSFVQTYDLNLTSSYNAAFITANGGTASSAYTALLNSIANGTAYFNIHTGSFPGGEIRGFFGDFPEVAVLESSANLADGGTLSFGTTNVGTSVTKTFTVTNVGTTTLTLAGLTAPSGFTITQNFGSSSLASGTSTTFQITMGAAAPATPSGTLSFTTNDGDEGTFDSTISGTVINSNNADLASLTTSASGFAPTFAAGTTAYTANVPNATTSVTVTATRAQANATLEVRVNGGSFTALTSGSASSALALNVGTNPIDVRVTAQDGTTQKTYTLTVTRAGVPPNLGVNDVTLNEGNSGTTTFSFTVSLSAPAPVGGVTFDIATANNTATQPSDYTQTSLTAQTIPAGSSSYTFNVPVVGDTTVEPTENFFVNVTNITNAIAVDSQGTGSITNDDVVVPPTITSVSPARGPIAGGTTVVITGTGFTGVSGVSFGSTPATGFTVDSPTQITATLPAGTGGIFDISVTAGTGTGTGSGLFYYFTTTGGTPAIAASKVDIFTPNGAGKVLPGAPIQYRTLIANTGAGDATTVDFADAIPANTTLVPGSVNVSPLAEDNVYNTIVNTQLAAGTPTVLSGPLVTSVTKVTDNDREFLTDTFTISAFDATSAAGGSVVMVTSGVNMGSFTYVPAPGFVGADSFTYTLRDDGTDSTAGNADDLTGVGIVVINVVEADTVASGTQKVWYIDGSYAGANGAEDGTSARPFNALSDVSGGGPDVAGDTLYLAAGNYTGGITLLADQSLIGANQALVLNSVTLAAAGTDPVITNAGGAGITLATGNTIRGLTVGDTTSDDISGSAVGNLTIANVNCSGQGGLLRISTSGALSVTLDSAVSTGSTNGVSLTGTTGTCTLTGGSITGATGDDFVVSGGTAVISYGGTITNSSGRSVNVASKTGGSVTFSGAITDTAGSTGISLTSNTGSTINFSGGLNLTTATSAAFTATGGGTVNVTGATNTLTTTTGTALNVANTTIGASGLTFQSISANGAANGIVLNNTGTSGGLTVTGTGNTTQGGNASGGTIQNTTGAGILLTNTQNVSLTNVTIQSTADSGIDGTQVTNFTFDNGTITNCGMVSQLPFISNIDFNDDTATLVTQVSGIVTITDSVLTNAYYGGVDIQNFSGAISNLSILNNSIVSSTSTATSKAPGIRVIAFGGADITRATINANTVTNFPSDAGIMVQGGNAVEGGNSGDLGIAGSGTDIIAITNNIISGASAANRIGTQGILTTVNGTGQGNFNITGNSVSHTVGNSISHNVFGDAIVTSTISNNTVISNNGLGAQGIAGGTSFTSGFATNTPSLRVTISGNNVSQTDGNGILFVARDLSNGVLAAKIVNNTVAAPLTGVRPGIRVDAGNATGDNAVFLEISGNTSAGSGAQPGIGLRKQGTVTATNRFAVRGMTATATPAIESYISTQNPAGNGCLLISATSGFSEWTGGGGQPAFLALLFAENLPEAGFEHSTAEMLPVDRIPPVTEKAAKADLTAQIAPKAVSPAETLTQATLEKLATEAIARWEASGLTPAQSAKLRSLRFELADLGALHLGQSRGDLIQISRKAGGNDWFIDSTPSDDSEFGVRDQNESGFRNQDSGIQGVDLLTTLMHEMGHALGLQDRYDLRSRRSLMFGHLTRGERRLPAKGEAAAALPFNDDTSRFLGATINIGTLPAGKSVTIVGTVLVNDPANTQLISSQGTVSGGNFTSVLTDDPAFAGAANPTTTPVERPDAAVVSIATGTTPTNAASVSWTVTFSTGVSNLASSHFALANTGLTAPSISTVTATGPQPATTWTVTASTGTGSGSLGLNMANDAGALSHDITNLPFTGQVYTIDKTPPVFTSVLRQTPSAQNTNADTLVFRATFSEAVMNVNAADFGVLGTSASITSITPVSTGVYDITVSGGDLASVNGTVRLTPGGALNISDLALNALPFAEASIVETYIVDNTAPTVAITSTTGNPAANAVIPVTVQFSETVTGFDLTDITVAGGSKGNFVAVDGDTYTFDLTPSGPGVTVTADIAANAAQDAAGNNNTAATQFTRTIVDAVSIAATTATAAEGGATGLYTFTRGSSTGDLTVSFQLDASSTATAATDFTLTSGGTLNFTPGTGAGTIVIPNGQLTATVTLTALAETPNPAEAAETARLNVVAGSGYVVGASPNATVTITENSFLVTTTANAGEGSLRQAVLNANSLAGTDTITFSDGTGGTVNFTDASADTITLSTQIPLSSSLSIQGTGAQRLIISGNNMTVSSGDVLIRGLTISGSTVGGIILASGSGNFTLIAVVVSGNSNTGSGGGLYQDPSTGNLTIINSTFSGNSGSSDGGGLQLNSSGTKSIINSTISGNVAGGIGGGIRSINALLTLTNCTVTNNTAQSAAVGAVAGVSVTSAADVSNSIIAGNVANNTKPDVGGAFTSGGGNLIGNAGTATGFTNGVNNDQVGNGASPINPQLAALANNGGPTQTHALLAGSPALNAGLPANIPADTFDLDGDTNVAEPLPFDQRGTGFTRAIGTVDIGAFELQKSVSIGNLAAISEGNSGTTNFVFTITRTGDTTGDVTMNYAVSGAAVNGTDFIGGTLPTGTATITSGNSTTTVTIPVSGDLTVEPNEAFTVTLTAPDNGYVVSGAPATSTITNDDSSTAVVASVNPSVFGQAVTFTATVSGGSISPTGTVAFSIDGGPALVVALTAGQASLSTSILSAGPRSVTATYSGDANLGTSSGSVGVTVNKANTTTALTSSLNPSVVAEAVTFTATVTAIAPGAGTPTGTVTFTVDGSPQAPVSLSGGIATFTTSSLAAGPRSIVASYNGSTSFNASVSGALNQTVNVPTVSVSAVDDSADENTAGIGIWRITRNTTAGSTAVQLQIDASSSAVAADWTQSGATFGSLAPGSTGSIVIPSGSSFVDFSLTPSADLHAEAAETVRVNVTADSAYTIGSPSNATVTIGQNDFLVINTNNAGEGTLRQAVLNANALVGDNTIAFSDGTGGTVDFTDATADTIALSGGEIPLASDLTIAGTGANVLVVQNTQAAGATSRVFNITNGLVRLRGLTITGGNATTDGGGIQIASATNVTLVGCSVSGNSTTAFGGGISSSAFSLSIVSSTISGNSAAGVNTAGGIHTTGITFNLVNSTISGNSSTSATGNNVGGILGNGTLINCTVTNNSVANPDPAFVGGVGGGFTISNSIIAGNVGNTTRPDIGGFYTSNGGNIIGNVGTATGFTATNDLTGTGAAPVNPFLGPLQDNGGPTLTHMLLNGSPAINNGLAANLPADTLDLDGDFNVAEALPVDQRGGVNLRTRGTAPDAGAVEAFAFEPTITASTTDEDTQSTSGLVVSANTADGGLTTHFKITGILNGTLFQNDGTTAIAEGSYITKAEGAAGLKFTPSLNLNTPNTPAGFGFSAQAAISTSAGDERGVAVPVVITVNSVNDLPTVVAPGLPDIRLTIGDVVVIPLGANFADVDLQTLTFTVSGNTVPAKASASITGTTNVTVTGLTFGVTDLTIQADDGTMGLVTDTFQVAVGTVNPTPTMPATPPAGWRVNSQTALFDIDVPVQNTTAFDINGFRLTVDLSAYAVSHPTLRLINYSSPAGVLPAYVDYPYPVAIGETVNVRLSFFVATRVMPNPFNPTLTVTKLTTSAVAGPLPVGPVFTQATIQVNQAGRILLTWPSTPGRWYRIYYSANLTTWTPSATPIQASANQVQWIDSGAPFTQTPPAGTRYYMVTEIPAPAP